MGERFVGEVACLAAATLWAFAVALFRRPIEVHGARAVNLVKCGLATVLLGVTVAATGGAGALLSVSGRDLGWIAASGVVGLTLGDTALFGAVARLGPYRTLLFQTLAPVFTAAIAASWWGEIPTAFQVGGALLILLGIVLVVHRPSPGQRRRVSATGVLLAVSAAFGQGAGIALAVAGMRDLEPLPAAFLRLGAATAGLVLISGPGRIGLDRLGSVLRSRAFMPRIVGATLIGTYLAFILMMVGIKLSPAAVAAVLLSTTPVFSLFVDAWTIGERITVRAVVGVTMAVAGVVWITLG